MDYSWPGNIRQLRNALRTASALCRDGLIRVSNLPQEILDTGDAHAVGAGRRRRARGMRSRDARRGAEGCPRRRCSEAECAALLRELERMRWNISRTAQTLGISRNTLYRKIHKHRILLGH